MERGESLIFEVQSLSTNYSDLFIRITSHIRKDIVRNILPRVESHFAKAYRLNVFLNLI